MKSGLIYKHTSPSGKVYVGKTTQTIEKRWKEHCYVASNPNNNLYDKHLYRAIRKYGPENFTHEVIVENVPHYLLNTFEKYWIRELNAIENGYNYGPGGEGHTSPEQKAAAILSNKTRVLSDETRQKMSESAKARGTMSKESYAQAARAKSCIVNIYNYETNELVAEHVYLNEFCRQHGYDRARFNAVLRGKRNHHKGLYAIKQENNQ